MKIKSIKYILSALISTIILTGCSNTDEPISTVVNTKQGILTFTSQEELASTVQKVNSMTPEERSAWEKSKGFKSFATTCDEVYKGIDPTKFKSLQQIKDTVSKLSAYLEIGQNEEGKCYVDSKESANPMRYLINKDKMYIIKNSVYKQFDEGSVVMSISKIEELKQMKSIENVKTDKSLSVIRKVTSVVDISSLDKWNENRRYVNFIQGYQTYALRVRLSTSQANDGTKSYRYINCTYNNYKWTLFTFWANENNQTSLIVSIRASDAVSLYGQWLDWTTYNYTSSDVKSETMENDAAHPTADNYIGIFGDPYFISYSVSASNTSGCVINESYTR